MEIKTREIPTFKNYVVSGNWNTLNIIHENQSIARLNNQYPKIGGIGRKFAILLRIFTSFNYTLKKACV
jgi:hypothetical protein